MEKIEIGGVILGLMFALTGLYLIAIDWDTIDPVITVQHDPQAGCEHIIPHPKPKCPEID